MAKEMSRWASRSLKDELPLKPSWMAAEEGRVGTLAHTYFAGPLGVRLTVVQPDEPRTGYSIGTITGRAQLPHEVSSRPTAVIAAFGARLPAIVGGSEEVEGQLVSSMFERIMSDAHAAGCGSIIVGPVPEQAKWRWLHRHLHYLRFFPLEQPPEATLCADGGPDAIVSNLSAGRRSNVRHEREVFRASSGEVKQVPVDQLDKDCALELLKRLYSKYGHRTTVEEINDRLSRCLTLPNASVLVASGREGMRGFALIVSDKERREEFLRLSAVAPNDYFTFFNLIFYSRVEFASRNGMHTLYYGDENYRAKVTRGCSVHRMYAYVRPLVGDDDMVSMALTERSRAVRAEVAANLGPTLTKRFPWLSLERDS